jgi:hypothetical protein
MNTTVSVNAELINRLRFLCKAHGADSHQAYDFLDSLSEEDYRAVTLVHDRLLHAEQDDDR